MVGQFCRWWSIPDPRISARAAFGGRRAGRSGTIASSRPQSIKTGSSQRRSFHGAVWIKSRADASGVGGPSPEPELVAVKASRVPKPEGVGFEARRRLPLPFAGFPKKTGAITHSTHPFKRALSVFAQCKPTPGGAGAEDESRPTQHRGPWPPPAHAVGSRGRSSPGGSAAPTLTGRCQSSPPIPSRWIGGPLIGLCRGGDALASARSDCFAPGGGSAGSGGAEAPGPGRPWRSARKAGEAGEGVCRPFEADLALRPARRPWAAPRLLDRHLPIRGGAAAARPPVSPLGSTGPVF